MFKAVLLLCNDGDLPHFLLYHISNLNSRHTLGMFIQARTHTIPVNIDLYTYTRYGYTEFYTHAHTYTLGRFIGSHTH